MLNHKDMDIELIRTTRLRALELVMDTRMSEGTSVREHIFKLTTYFKVLEVLDADIDGEVQVDMILHSLPALFTQFKMNKVFFSTSELMSFLQAMEEIVKLEPYIDKHSSSETKPKDISLPKRKQGFEIGEHIQLLERRHEKERE